MASSSEDPVSREDTEALLEVRRELGLAYEKELVDSFAERIEAAVAQRVDARGASDLSAREKDKRQLSLGIVTIGVGIPITAISAALADLPGLGVAWVGLVGVNVAYALSGRHRH